MMNKILKWSYILIISCYRGCLLFCLMAVTLYPFNLSTREQFNWHWF